MQPAFGGGGGAAPQPGSGERVLRVVECGGERGPPGHGVFRADRVEERGDGLVDVGDGRPFPVEAEVETEVAGDGGGRGQDQPQQEQPSGTGEEGEDAPPPGVGQRHPCTHGRCDQQLGPRPGRHGPDGADTPGDQSEPGQHQGQRHRPEMPAGVRPDEQPERPRERGYADPPHGGTAAARPVVDACQHGGDRGDDPEGGPPGDQGGAQQRPAGQRAPDHRVPGHRAALGVQGVAEPGRECVGGGAEHGVRGSCRPGEAVVSLRATVAGLGGALSSVRRVFEGAETGLFRGDDGR